LSKLSGHLLQLSLVEHTIFVRVVALYNPLHAFGQFFLAELAVLVFVEAHDSFDESRCIATATFAARSSTFTAWSAGRL
jgi:hypothetical protein